MNPCALVLCLLAVAAPADVESLLTSARSALSRGETDRALALASSAVDAAPDKAAPYALRAAVHAARREFDKSVADCTKVLSITPDDASTLHRRGEAHFRLNHFKESVADFDREVSLDPSREPYHWQRGISLYYAGEYARGAKQFELHRTVNGDDVENAAWHYLCVARQAGVEKARQSLLPVGPDGRVPMKEIYDLFAGRVTPEAVLGAATANNPPEVTRKERLFYAHLYVALYHDAAGSTDKAREHTRLAVQHADEDYMGDVARVQEATIIKQR